MTVVTVFPGNIRNFFERQAFRGASIPGTNAKAEALARAMVAQARRNADEFDRRTDELRNSVVPIVRKSPRSGALTIGVGTTVKHGQYLEEGTTGHPISIGIAGASFGAIGRPPYVLRSGGPRDRPPGYQNRRPLLGAVSVNHPGNPAFRWLARAVESVMGRGV